MLALSALPLAAQEASPASPGTGLEENTVDASNDEPQATKYNIAALESVYDAYFSPEGGMSYTGAVVTLVKDGEIVLNKGYGFDSASRTNPVDIDTTLFPAGSITKTLVGIATAQLILDGTFASIDDPVNRYLERADIPDNDGEKITLRMLATHQAGFAEIAQPYMGPGDDVPETDGRYIKSVTPPYIREPLSGPVYSNAGIAFLGYAAEDATQKSFNTLMDERVFGPAKMQTARIVAGPLDRTGVAQGEVFYPNGGRREVSTQWANNHTLKTAGGLVATGTDMGHYMIALLGGSNDGAIEDILGDDGRELAFSTQGAYHELLQRFGLTFMLNDWNGTLLAEHGGRVLAGASYMTLLPEENIGLFVSVTGESGTILPAASLLGVPSAPAPQDDAILPLRRPTLSTLRALPLEELLGRYLPPIPTDRIDADLEDYIGEYMAERRSKSSAMKLFKTLFLGGGPLIVSDLGDGTLRFGAYGVYEPIGTDIFYKQAARSNQGASGWSDVLVFRRDASGKVIDAATTYTDTMFRKTGGFMQPSSALPLLGLGAIGALTGLLAIFWSPRIRARWIAIALPIGLIALPIVMFRSWPNANTESLSYLLWKPSDMIGFQLLGNFLALGAASLVALAIAGLLPNRSEPNAPGFRSVFARWHLRLMSPFLVALLVALIWLNIAGWHLR